MNYSFKPLNKREIGDDINFAWFAATVVSIRVLLIFKVVERLFRIFLQR